MVIGPISQAIVFYSNGRLCNLDSCLLWILLSEVNALISNSCSSDKVLQLCDTEDFKWLTCPKSLLLRWSVISAQDKALHQLRKPTIAWTDNCTQDKVVPKKVHIYRFISNKTMSQCNYYFLTFNLLMKIFRFSCIVCLVLIYDANDGCLFLHLHLENTDLEPYSSFFSHP